MEKISFTLLLITICNIFVLQDFLITFTYY